MSSESKNRQKWVRVRMAFVITLLVCGLAAVIGRVYYLQTVQAADLQEMSVDQTARKIKVKAKRGSILDRRGVELAVTIEVPSIFARPKQIENPRLAARRLMPHMDVSFKTLVKKLESDSPFVWLDRQAKPSSAKAIKKLDIDGIGITTGSKRYYPLQERAGQLLGFVGIDGNGLEGLERTLDETLAGGEFSIAGMRDARGRTLLTRDLPQFRKFEGDSVVLTIDERIQRVAEQAVTEQVEKHDAKGGYAVAIDVNTGEVLALANTPNFDPNRFGDFSSKDWRMRNITDTFEPGSTFKPFVLAAALEKGTVNLNTQFDTEKGRIKIGRYTIRDSHAHDMLSAAEIIQVSSNIGVYKIAQTLGKKGLYQTLRDFGFGSRTGVGLRGEQPGLIWPPDRWAEVSFANIAFGQGLTATPLQTATGIAALANGGMLMKPRIIKEVRDKDGEVVEQTRPTLVRRVISPESARKTAWAMSLVTLEDGTGTNAAMEHFTVAGKTGTAQKVNPETRRYDPDMWVGSFVGFAPAEKPEVAVIVMIDEPQDTHYGGVVAAPAFKKIMKEALSVRGVMPLPEEERFHFDDEDAQAVAESAKSVESTVPEDVVTLPTVRVESPDADQAAQDGTLPDLRGLTLRQALAKARRIGVLPQIDGWGRVVSQEPAPGQPIGEQTRLTLVLSPATRGALFSDEPAAGSVK
ncbi:PASTA domain-containing protein [Persicimonas caeni]|uniref:PASTA domain-containing protein n=1 Tax=Persicimonas caeni TaxID=2292766 RepID=A0A4Y6Q3P8_PERCE|nr:penicillin-binding protein [Persicimonas caeni]QDG54777.1 PASTA domain-containing protein [Persicimonas caeni]QED35998.1 PASTA domain-containing protein [Persicimonas caeni]